MIEPTLRKATFSFSFASADMPAPSELSGSNLPLVQEETRVNGEILENLPWYLVKEGILQCYSIWIALI